MMHSATQPERKLRGQQPPRGKRRRVGFTLVELLVTIAIIAVLATLLSVLAMRIRARAHKAGCASNLRQLGIALNSYVSEAGRFPSWPGSGAEYGVPWDRLILPYLTDESVDFAGEQGTPIRKDSKEAAAMVAAAGLFRCPGDNIPPPDGLFKRSYSMCNWTCNQADAGGAWHNGWPELPKNVGVRANKVNDPQNAVVIVEFRGPESGTPPHIVGSANFNHAMGFLGYPNATDFNWHGREQNILFMDGHVGSESGTITDTEWYRKGYSPPRAPKL